MDGDEAGKRRRRPSCAGCAGIGAGALALVVGLVVLIGTLLDQGEGARTPGRSYNAGAVTGYETPSVVHLEQQHVFVVRMPDGAFLALYDRSSRQQELGGTCRIRFDDSAGIGALEPIAGITGAFVEDCDERRTVWRADGTFAFGAGYEGVPMDELRTSVNDAGELIIDLSGRTCYRSRGVIGVAPFDRERCGRPT